MSETVIRSENFIDTLGVNTHLDFGGNYSNLSLIEADIKYLGVTNLRDSAQNPADAQTWLAVSQATGAKFDDYIGETSPAGMATDLSYMTGLAQEGVLNFIEGGNEEDDSYPASLGNTVAITAAFQQQVSALGHQLGLPVINMSFGAGWTAANNWHGDYDKVGNLSAYATYGNAHTYPSGAPDTSIQQLNSDALLAAPSDPVITTEFGYDTSVTDPTQAAKWTLDAMLDGMKDGNPLTYIYALIDDGSGNFGLMNTDGTPKPAGLALHNLTTLLADTGSNATTFATGTLNYTLAGTQTGDNTLLMEKSDGSYWISIWNESVSSHSVTINLGSTASQIKVFDPLTNTSVIQSASNTNTITITVPDHPVLVEIIGAGGTTTTPTTPVTTPTTPVTTPTTPTTPVTTPTTPVTTPTTPVTTPTTPVTTPTTPATQTGPAITVPGSESVTTGTTTAITGVSVADAWAATNPGTLALNVTSTGGNVSLTNTAGAVVSGSALALSGTLAQINTELSSLKFQAGAAGSGTISVQVYDQAGLNSTQTTAVKIAAATAPVTTPTAPVTTPTTPVTTPTTPVTTPTTPVTTPTTPVTTPTTPVTTPTTPVTTPPAQTGPAISVPASETVTTGATTAISGLSVSDAWAAANPGTLALNVSSTGGSVSLTNTAGATVSGTALALSGTLAQINTELAGLKYQAGSAGSGSISVQVYDQAGLNSEKSLAVSIAAAPVTPVTPTTPTTPAAKTGPAITVPGTESVTTATTTAISGFSVADAWAATNPGTLALNVTSTGGSVTLTNAAGAAVTGSNLALSGTLAQVNSELSSLKYQAGSAGTGSISVQVYDQAGLNSSKTVAMAIGSNNVVTGTSGNDTITVPGNGMTVNTLAGNDMVFLSGTGDVVNAGSGANTITDNGSKNQIVLPGPGGGTDDIYGSVMTNGDTFNLASALADTSWNGAASTLGNFVSVASSGGNALVSINPTGTGTGGTLVATLHGAGTVSLQTLIAHSQT